MDLVREYSVSAVGRFRYSASSKHYMDEQVSKMKFKFKFIEELISKKRIKKSMKDFDTLWKSDINDIWSITDKNQFLIAMKSWLFRKCDEGENIGKLSHAERIFYLNDELESEVNNGGFSQFFYNSSGDHANETTGSLIAIGADQTAGIFRKALTAFECVLPEDRDERIELLDRISTDRVEKILSECDDEFFKYPDDLAELNHKFILINMEEFT
ncbi:DUF4375 domain-containing protein [Candidatus Nomurabacteria bacterium]|nr:DUF4375 domain-containing protein [Candidatus Nomurabacteria bacterium]